MRASAPASACLSCGFKLGEPIATLSVSELCFVSDHRFPGRCVATLQLHATADAIKRRIAALLADGPGRVKVGGSAGANP